MDINSEINRVSGLRKSILSIFAIFSFSEIIKLLIVNNVFTLATLPILLYFIISPIIILKICLINSTCIRKHPIENITLIMLYFIYSSYNFIFSSVFINVENTFDIHFSLSAIMFVFLMLGIISGSFFKKDRDVNLFKNETIIRGNEIELRKFNPWADLSLDKAPWLRKPLKGLHYAVAVFILLIGGSAAGLSIAIAEGLKRSGLLGDDINTHAFLFFVMGVPIGIAMGVVIAPLISYLYHWRKLLKTVKKEHGSYTVLLNLEKKPYSELKQELSEG